MRRAARPDLARSIRPMPGDLAALLSAAARPSGAARFASQAGVLPVLGKILLGFEVRWLRDLCELLFVSHIDMPLTAPVLEFTPHPADTITGLDESNDEQGEDWIVHWRHSRGSPISILLMA